MPQAPTTLSAAFCLFSVAALLCNSDIYPSAIDVTFKRNMFTTRTHPKHLTVRLCRIPLSRPPPQQQPTLCCINITSLTKSPSSTPRHIPIPHPDQGFYWFTILVFPPTPLVFKAASLGFKVKLPLSKPTHPRMQTVSSLLYKPNCTTPAVKRRPSTTKSTKNHPESGKRGRGVR